MANLVSRITSSGTYNILGQFDEVSYNTTSGGTIAYSTASQLPNTNLLISSADFNAVTSAYRVKTNVSTIMTTATTAPDGSYTAQKLVEDNTSTTHIMQTNAYPVNLGTVTISVYAKAAERKNIFFWMVNNNGSVGQINISLITGQVTIAGTSFSAEGIGYVVTPVGNGWWRLSITGYNSTAGGSIYMSIAIDDDTGTSYNYSGDGSSGIYLWGAQIEYGLTATNYVATDNYGPIPRANTNLYTQTQGFPISSWDHDSSTSNAKITLTSATTAPDGSLTAYKFSSNTGTNPNIGNGQLLTQSSGYDQYFTVGSYCTQSMFFKAAEFNTLRIRNNSTGEIYDFVAGTTPVATSGVLRPVLQNVGNGWYRASWTFVAGQIGGVGARNDNWSYRLASTGDGVSGIYIWGPQLQTGNVLAPYVATSTANTAINNFTTRTDNQGNILTIGNIDEITYVNKNKNLVYPSSNLISSVHFVASANVIPNLIIAPDGSTTAALLRENTDNSSHVIQFNLSSSVPANTQVTFSCYFKPYGGNRQINFQFHDNPANDYASVTLANTLSSIISGPSGGGSSDKFQNLQGNIVSVGNGWYRAILSAYTYLSTGNISFAALLWNNGNQSYTGDGTSGVYFWGPQVELNSTATSYAPNPNKNLFVNTENLTASPWFIPGNSANVVSTKELDPNGNYTASKFAYNTANPNIKQNSIPVTPNTNYTISISAKGTGVPGIAMVSGNGTFFPNDATQFTNFNFGTGQTFFGVFPNYIYATMKPENNGYYRCSATLLTDATQNAISVSFWQGGYGYGTAGNTMTLFGPQLELGNTATQYTANTINLISSKTFQGGGIEVINEFDEVTFNPPIVTANLTLHLDAANPASYNGGTTWYDMSGRGNHGTLSSNVLISGSNYGSMYFDGTDSYPNFSRITFNTATGNSVGMYQSDFTVEAWVNAANTGNTAGISPNYPVFGVNGSSPTGNSNYSMSFSFGNLGTGFYDSGVGVGSYSGFTPSNNVWYHIVHTHNYTTRLSKLYFNGSLMPGYGYGYGTAIMPGNLNANAAIGTVEVGHANWGGGSFWGSIPVVRVYNKELSQAEINQNYNALAYRYKL